MYERTRALAISPKVKKAVWKRDSGMCIFCYSPDAGPWCHFISRAQGGLGIEQNILTLCIQCHNRYDSSSDRLEMREFFRRYLRSKYDDWDETKLIYNKWQ